jgi:hypothetical protein
MVGNDESSALICASTDQSIAGVDDQCQSGSVVLAEKLLLHQADVPGAMRARVALQ